MKPISGLDIWHQLKADLFGKDSYRGVTLTYSWMANQFGHFSLGFIPTLLVYAYLEKSTSLDDPSLMAALGVSIFWFLFELYNFLVPLLFNRRRRSGLLVRLILGSKYQFEPKWGNVAFDTFTDLCFFWLGACSGAWMIKSSILLIYFLGSLFIICLGAGAFWYVTKMYLQYAQYPAQLRLSQYHGHITEDDKAIVNHFLKDKTHGLNLFVFGSAGSGKTPMSIGLATELSIRHESCLYVTAMKLFSMFCEPDAKPQDKKYFWSWRKASVLVIDDINPGEPIHDLITPEQFLSMIDGAPGDRNMNRKILAKKKIIWVLGDQNTDGECLENWAQMLEEIGVNRNNINSVNLQKNRKVPAMAEYGSHMKN